jgi:hypothetical protein
MIVGLLAVLGVALLVVSLLAALFIRSRNLHRWLGAYLADRRRRRDPRPDEEVHVILCLCDHYEPRENNVSDEVALARVRAWVENYPQQLGGFRDSDGRTPRHTFFFPAEEYREEYLDALAGLCRAGFGEVEIHLHHDGDTPENLRATLLAFKHLLRERHGLLSQRADGEIVYGFIHGNWALDNSHPDGIWCGINNELDILRETGCYADFTLPSAPSPCQTRTINRIYYAVDDPLRPKSHDTGTEVGTAPTPANSLLIVQGPLLLDWGNRRAGILPRIENACVQDSQPATLHRLRLWLRARIQVPSRPDWFFVKLHCHGAPEGSHHSLLGDPMVEFHAELARLARENTRFHFHYVTARELVNLVRAAEGGWTGDVASALDHEFPPPPLLHVAYSLVQTGKIRR